MKYRSGKRYFSMNVHSKMTIHNNSKYFDLVADMLKQKDRNN